MPVLQRRAADPERVRDRLEGRLRFAFRHFPLTEVHPDAQRAAEASEAAAAQGAFWPMHDALYGAGGLLGSTPCSPPRAGSSSTSSGSARSWPTARTPRAWRSDIESGRAAGVTGTPAFFVNGARHEGGYDAQSLIAALERTR